MLEAFDIIVESRNGTIERPVILATLQGGEKAFLRKLGEVASQGVMACKDHKYGEGSREEVEEGISDVLFYLMIALAHHEVENADVFRIMWEKRGWPNDDGEGFQQAMKRIVAVSNDEVKDSHIRKTLRKGDDKILRKIGEEASEAVMACKDYGHKKKPRDYVAEEVGDVLYYTMIAMVHHELETGDVFGNMRQKYAFEGVSPAAAEAERAAASPDYPDRPLALSSAYYIERPPIEADCHQEILKPGALIRIRGPQGFGKTSLLNRILSGASDRGMSTVRLNLEMVDRDVFTSLNKFLRWLCAMTTRQLQLESRLDEHWDDELLGPMENCTAYFQEYLLEELEEPLVLGLDAVDRLFDAPEVAQDFFALMRVWHEEASNLEIWERLRLVVAHSTEVYIPLKLNQSPFNVGMPIRLPEFTVAQVQELAERYQLDWSAAEAEKLMAMVGGHPYLVQLALYQLHSESQTLDTLLAAASTQTGIYSNFLGRHFQRLKEHPELASALKEVLAADAGARLEPVTAYKLESLGLARLDGEVMKPSCELYRQYFPSLL
jgi:phosphoribosyl-ATP pyrophosphohydrolase